MSTDGWIDAGWSEDPDRKALRAAADIVDEAATERQMWAAGLADLLVPKLYAEAVAEAARKMTDRERDALAGLWAKAGYASPPHWHKDE